MVFTGEKYAKESKFLLLVLPKSHSTASLRSLRPGPRAAPRLLLGILPRGVSPGVGGSETRQAKRLSALPSGTFDSIASTGRLTDSIERLVQSSLRFPLPLRRVHPLPASLRFRSKSVSAFPVVLPLFLLTFPLRLPSYLKSLVLKRKAINAGARVQP